MLALDCDQKKITKIHDFSLEFDKLCDRLCELSIKYPSGLIIPIIENDLRSPVLERIITELNTCDYLKKVFFALSVPDKEGYEDAMKVASRLKIPCDVVWCNRPEVTGVLDELRKKGLDVTKLSGKGKDLWLTMGIASLELYAFAVHDADVVYYDRMLPTKLLYPVIEPKLDFFFAKGYYARVNVQQHKMYGRIFASSLYPYWKRSSRRCLGNHGSYLICNLSAMH